MKSFTFAFGATLFAAPALAADLIYAEPVAPATAPIIEVYDAGFVWTGLYAGGTIGYVFDNATRATAFDNTGTFSRRYLTDDDGITAGAFGGYNAEWNGFVVGVEGDIEYLDSQDSRATFRGGAVTGADISWQGSFRGRVGYAFDRTLVYATGGLAIGGIDYFAADAIGSVSSNSTETGYTVGGGVDFAATDALFLRGEYRFTDYGSETISTPVNSYEFDTRSHAIKAGVGFRF